MGSSRAKWDQKKLAVWVWRFIRENRSLPKVEDFTGTKSPSFDNVLREFGSLDNLINASGPPLSSNTVMPNNFGYLRKAFEKFRKEAGHYPMGMEIDACKYFPRVRSLERSWGGVTVLRELFGLEILDYSGGRSRSDTADRVNRDAFAVERQMEATLIEMYGEEFVHIERRWGKENKSRLDFFVYSKNGSFGVDVFNPSTILNLKVEVLIKMKQYHDAEFPLFLVYTPLLESGEVERYMKNKKTPLPGNIKVVPWDSFLREIALKYPRRD